MALDLGVLGLQKLRFRSEDKVEGGFVAIRVGPEDFPHFALDAVALHCATELPRDGQSQSVKTTAVAAVVDDEDSRVEPLSCPEDLVELPRAPKALPGPEAEYPLRGHTGCGRPRQTASRFRPLARRRFRTRRPPRVFILARKPCLRFLRLLFG